MISWLLAASGVKTKSGAVRLKASTTPFGEMSLRPIPPLGMLVMIVTTLFNMGSQTTLRLACCAWPGLVCLASL